MARSLSAGDPPLTPALSFLRTGSPQKAARPGQASSFPSPDPDRTTQHKALCPIAQSRAERQTGVRWKSPSVSQRCHERTDSRMSTFLGTTNTHSETPTKAAGK
ncbi:hypothetical protein DPEC_G00216520 [Dallia pectoralis]|uniref:Uncharacterized protein n=1 Tax=Dallia pectoralis TaxID=75939 RepID=A0ACC2G2P3_DALPE|nr:hypothetical protein DPEC_G00216520 [Dallia pectoralis]